MLLAGMRLAQFGAQLRHLAPQRIEGAGELLRDGAERAERRLQLAALVVDQFEW